MILHRLLTTLRTSSTTVPLLIITLTLFLLYVPSLSFPLLWDDTSLIGQSLNTVGLERIHDAFTGHYLSAISDQKNAVPYYRPISLSLLVLQRTYLDGWIPGYRLTSLLFHLLSAILLFFIVRHQVETYRPDSTAAAHPPALFAALIFCTLPYNADAVVFISNLGDLMTLSGLLLCAITAHRFLQTGHPGALAGLLLATAMAIGSKETGVIALPLLSLIMVYHHPHLNRRRALTILIPVLVMTLAFLMARSAFLQNTREVEPLTALVRLPRDLLIALRWALLPHPVPLMDNAADIRFDPIWYTGLLVILLITFLLWYFRTRATHLILPVSFWFLAILPSLLATQLMQVFSPRYLYVPSAAIALICGYVMNATSPFLRKGLWLLPVVLMLLILIRVHSWSSDLALWSLEMERRPDNPMTLSNYGLAVEKRERFDEALTAYHRGIQLAEARDQNVSLSNLYQRKGNLLSQRLNRKTEALEYYQKAIRLHATSTLWLSVGHIHVEDHAFEPALLAFRKAAALSPDSYRVLVALAGALGGTGQFNEAIEVIDRAIAVARHNDELRAQAQQRRSVLLQFRDQYSPPAPP